MVRGRRSIYIDLLTDTIEPLESQELLKKGRSADFIEQRNICLAHRYWYYIKIRELKYEQAINKVSKEFFLCTRTIIDILQQVSETIKTVKKEAKTIKDLKTLYPFMDWTPKA